MITPHAPKLFMTGATGFLGHYVLHELIGRSNACCRALIRPPLEKSRVRLRNLLAGLSNDLDALCRLGRIELVEGDLHGGVPSTALRGIDSLVHCAAHTGFARLSNGEPHRTNVEGTHRILEAATAAGVRRVAYVSTAFVCGRSTGLIPEAVVPSPPEFYNAYEQTKWEAEQLVWDWGRRHGVATILRPSILFGDRTLGRATKFGGVYLVARATELIRQMADEDASLNRRRIPLRILGLPEAECNLIPVDWAARQIADRVLKLDRSGAVHHITNPTPPSHQQIKQWLEEVYEIGGGTFCDDDWPLRNPNRFEDLFYTWGDSLRHYFRPGVDFQVASDYLERECQPLITRELFHRALVFAHRAGWGRRASSGEPSTSVSTGIRPSWYFEDFLPRRIPMSIVAHIHALTATIRFEVEPPHEVWTCRFDRGSLAAVHSGGNSSSWDFGFRVARDAFADLISGRRPLQAAFFSGFVDILGNAEQALRMVPIMMEFIREHPALD